MMEQTTSFDAAAWCARVCEKAHAKMRYALKCAWEVPCIPYMPLGASWRPDTKIDWWTNGFWPASMWRMYLLTGESYYADEARRTEEMLDEVFATPEKLHHDVGFMWNISSGVSYRLTGCEKSLRRWMHAANVLAGRYNPTGFIRAWPGEKKAGWSIIDTMMNIPLLYRASVQMNDPRYAMIARLHADTALKHFIRSDGSVNHIVIFDPFTGEFLDNPGGQGIASGSSWSRGQAWALYGFTLSYVHTGERRYLDAAKRVAHYFISCCCDDWVPDCDFRAPKDPVVKDNCAGAIAACGLLELAKQVEEAESALYYRAAVALMVAMDEKCADWSENSPAILTKCTSSYHDLPGRNIQMQYGDYFFLEALHRLKDPDAMLFW